MDGTKIAYGESNLQRAQAPSGAPAPAAPAAPGAARFESPGAAAAEAPGAPQKAPEGRTLDKLAQLPPTPSETPQNGLIRLRKRARAKYITNGVTNQLRKVKSPLHQSYLRTFFCSSSIQQVGDKLTARYCRNRWCIVCNRIRIAQLIAGYKAPLLELKDLQFVTLSDVSVKANELRSEINEMIAWVQREQKHNFSRKRKPLVGLRKLECTYNPNLDAQGRGCYHPHFHFLIEGKENGEELRKRWIETHPTCNPAVQQCKAADEGSLIELFKYFTKIFAKRTVYAEPLDIIFRAMRGKRVFQPMGVKRVSEDIEELITEVMAELPAREASWEWVESSSSADWFNPETGERLSGYEPSEEVLRLRQDVPDPWEIKNCGKRVTTKCRKAILEAISAKSG